MTYYLSLGSNLGEREQTIRHALQLIEEQIGVVACCSSYYYSAPWGYESEHGYCNVCCRLETVMEPLEVLHATQAIERQLGRTHKTMNRNYTDRVIDIDLIQAYDDRHEEIRRNDDELTLPHPLWEEREFVVVPLKEIQTNE